MFQFFELLRDFFVQIFALLNYFTFSYQGFDFSILGIFLSLGFFALIASAFWRGAKK